VCGRVTRRFREMAQFLGKEAKTVAKPIAKIFATLLKLKVQNNYMKLPLKP
jgi:hypothetical protein